MTARALHRRAPCRTVHRVAGRASHARFGVAGDARMRLVAGPLPSSGPEPLDAHERRLGRLDLFRTPEDLRGEISASGLVGRGGGEFPLARKLETAAAAGGEPVVVVNASEGEPASRKDRMLVELRPHLVLDGAAVAARAVGAQDIAVYLHAGREESRHAIAAAIVERERHGLGSFISRIVQAPDRYVAGESSAVVNFLQRGTATPERRPVPVAAAGIVGRPTVVANAETLAHLALVARHGAGWFAGAGSPGAPGSTLVTLAGAVAAPGLVVEVLAPVPLLTLLSRYGGRAGGPGAVLIGGYGGRWIGADAAAGSLVDRALLRRVGSPLGCGLIAPLGPDSCGPAVTLHLLRYLAMQSAGRCGPCAVGLPALAKAFGRLVWGTASRGDLRRMIEATCALRGRGDCAHPDGAVALVESALEVFAVDVARHVRGRPCGGDTAGWFPTATRGTGAQR